MGAVRTAEDVYDDGSGLSGRRATDVRAGVVELAVLDDQHADEHARLDLLGDDDAAVRVRAHAVVVLVPVDVVRRLRTSGRVAHQLDRTVRLHVLRTGHLDRWTDRRATAHFPRHDTT